MAAPTWLGDAIVYENGTGPRYTLRAFKGADLIDECGGDPVSPLYEPQAKRLIQKAIVAGYRVEAEAHTPNGGVEVTEYGAE
jgi:hypothetical protein